MMNGLANLNRTILIAMHTDIRAKGIAAPMKDAMVFEKADGEYEFFIPHLNFKWGGDKPLTGMTLE